MVVYVVSTVFWALHWSFIVSVILCLKQIVLLLNSHWNPYSEIVRVLERPGRTTERRTLDSMLGWMVGWHRRRATMKWLLGTEQKETNYLEMVPKGKWGGLCGTWRVSSLPIPQGEDPLSQEGQYDCRDYPCHLWFICHLSKKMN